MWFDPARAMVSARAKYIRYFMINFLAYLQPTPVAPASAPMFLSLNEVNSILCLMVARYSPTYLPMIAASFFFVSAGITSGCVRIAWRSADPHLHSRGEWANLRTASRMIVCALEEFLFRYSMIISTVTAS